MVLLDAPAQAAPAWFGKIACLGDFASRRMEETTVRTLDDWLVAGLGRSRALLGARWLDVYLTSPLWRFALAPGVVGAPWWFGILMPSVDSAGRYFPLLAGQRLASAPSDRTGLDTLEAWYEAIANAALATLDPASSVDAFEQALAALPMLSADDAVGRQAGPAIGALACGDAAGGASPAQALWQAARTEMLHRLKGCSMWGAWRPGGGTSRVRTVPGLPAPEAFVRLFEGTW